MTSCTSITTTLVSIHAPLTGGDVVTEVYQTQPYVSIHAPLTGGDDPAVGSRRWGAGFQSTPPSREATRRTLARVPEQQVSIHAPLTEGDVSDDFSDAPKPAVSIHAPLTGGDCSGNRF